MTLHVLFAAPRTLLSILEQTWAYVTLGLSGIVTEEVAPLVGGLAAHDGHLGFTRVVLACAGGTWLASTALYFIGEWRATWVQKRWLGAGGKMSRALEAIRIRPWRASFFVRFAFGARVVLPMVCGTVRMPLGIYLAGSAIGSLVWSALFVSIGWAFGESAKTALGQVRRYEDVLAAVIVVVVATFFIVAAVARRRRRRPHPVQLPAPPVEAIEPAE